MAAGGQVGAMGRRTSPIHGVYKLRSFGVALMSRLSHALGDDSDPRMVTLLGLWDGVVELGVVYRS